MTEALQFALIGLGTGAVYALLAQSIVVVYRGSGVLNFASGAVGMFGAYVFYELRDNVGVSAAVSLAAALASCALLGVAMHVLVMRRLSNAPQTSRIVVTLGLMLVLVQAISMTWASGGVIAVVVSPLPSEQVSFGDDFVVGADRLVLLGLAVVLSVLLMLAQRRTRLGLATTAVAENRVVAASMGWNPDVIGAAAWGLGSMLAAVAIIFTAPFSGLSTQGLALLVVPAMAAALLGRFESIWWALVGGLAIGIANAELSRYVAAPGWETAAPLVIIVVALAVRGSALPGRTQRSEWRASVGTGIVRPWVLVLAGAAAVLIATGPVTWLDAVTTTLLVAILLLSIVVLTGYAGQLSLAQSALAGIAAYVTATLAIRAGIPLAAAVPLGALAALPIGLVVALPALRTRGSNLAIATLSLAVGIDSLLISNPDRLSSFADKSLGEFEILGFGLSSVDHPERFAILVLAIFVAAGVAVANLRRGAVGRRLLAVRSNERAAASLGISVARVKLYAFGLATLIAGVAGSLTEARFASPDMSQFPVISNITAVLNAIIGGIGWIAGALVGSLGAPGALVARIVSSFTATAGDWVVLIGAAAVILVVLQAPDGVAPMVARQARESAPGRWLARRGGAREQRRRAALAIAAGDGGADAATSTRRRSPASLTVNGLSVRFGQHRALDDVSLSVCTGEIVGLIGPNGAGKSTLIDAITGFERPEQGGIALDERPIDRDPPARRARLGISRSFQNLELFEDMAVLENLLVAADDPRPTTYVSDLLRPGSPRLTPATRVAIADLGLGDAVARLPRELDYARRRLVAIARSLSTAPKLVLLDEPAAGLDQAERQELGGLIRRVAGDWDVGVVLVEHDMELVFSICDRVVVLDQGRVIASGKPNDVRANPAVIEAYLGAGLASGSAAPAVGEARS